MLSYPKDPEAPLTHEQEAFLHSLNIVHGHNLDTGIYPDQATVEAYMSSLQLLHRTYALHRETPGRQTIAVLFPDLVLTDIFSGRVSALCLAAGYAVVLRWLRHNVWIQDWGRRVVLAVARRLRDSEAKNTIQWCVQEVER
jgi:hypothetical protein